MKRILLSCLSLLAIPAQVTWAQSGYEGREVVTRPPTGAATVVPRASLDRLNAVFQEPSQASRAVIGMFTVCRTITLGGEFGEERIEFETCDPVIVWCPNPDGDCITVN